MDIRWESGGSGRVARSVVYRDYILSQAPQTPIPACLDKSDAIILDEIDELNRRINNDEYIRNTQTARCVKNQEFTRFRFNNFPHDQTLVPLSSGRFINASFVLNKQFIGTQAPMPHTNEDFWSMVWEHDVPVVVMLNRLGDPGDDIYFPFSLSDNKKYGDIHLKLIEEPFFKTDTSWRQSPHEEEPHAVIHRKISVQRHAQEKLVHHFQYQNWRDFSAGNERAAAYLVKAVNAVRLINPGPTVAHCHAGVGRTSVAITLFDEALRLPNGTVDIKRSVERQRSPDEGRCNSMMQATDQYHFCYRTLREIYRLYPNNLKN
jgi:protein tyrosine phosphatase